MKSIKSSQRVKNSDAIERSLLISDRYLNKALAILDDLPASKSKKALREIAMYIGKTKILIMLRKFVIKW